MDGPRSVDLVKSEEPTTEQLQVPSHKSLPRAKFVEPLTPLHRLARFKEIRDRNLARDKNLRKGVQYKRNSLAPTFMMDTVVNGSNLTEPKHPKLKSLEKLSNGNDSSSITNGAEHTTNGNCSETGSAGPALEQNEAVKDRNLVETIETPPKPNEVEANENLVDSDASNEPVEDNPVSEHAVTGNEKDEEDESDGGDCHESEGSSLDVVGESSSESLDLQVSLVNSEEASEKDPGPSHAAESAPPAQDDPPKIVTPELVRRIRARERIGVRRGLRDEHSNFTLKRKLDDEEESSSGKKVCEDGSTSSPGWQFFSPTKHIKFWTPFRSTPKPLQSACEADESMVVNVDDQSNIFDKINEETAATLIEESQEKPSQRWCAIM